MMSDIYPSVITDSLLERIALNVHLSYDSSNVDEEIAHFWQSSYSRDSSRATALGLIYRMYDASIFLKNYRDYHSLSFAKLTALADEYQKLIQENSSAILTYAMAEQSRWNCFMLSRGWLPATDKQMRAYMTVGGHSSHKHELSKLHPFIRDWEDINGGEGSLYRRARESTLKSIADTRKFLTIVRPVQSLESSTKNK